MHVWLGEQYLIGVQEEKDQNKTEHNRYKKGEDGDQRFMDGERIKAY